MTRFADSRSLRSLAAGLALGGGLLSADLAAAQGLPFTGFAPLPSFAWPQGSRDGQTADDEESRWAGSYARMSTGFEAFSSKRSGSYAGPTVGFEGGRMWREGRLVYGIAGGFDYLALPGGAPVPAFGRLAYTRDFAGGLQAKVGALVTPEVLVYAKAGAYAVHETLRLGATSVSGPVSREDIALRPDARVGVEWAITDRLSVAVEAGVGARGFR